MAAFVVVIRVVMVRTVVTPSATRAGAASRLSQNDTFDWFAGLCKVDRVSY